MNRINMRKRSLLIACLFMVSVLVVTLKLMNPTEIHIYLEGEESTLSQVMRNYSLFDVAFLVASAFIGGVCASYLLFFEGTTPIGDQFFNNKKNEYEKILPILKDDEQKVFKAILESEGILAQSEISEITGVSKSNVSRALDLLESKGYVERRRRGMGNVIVLK